ncbi:glycosyltransferase family 4 protein [Gelidibacter japonicus]|uniref:glycosyltransferase family 4 protein n=1 Tax=Gelidibacter japonicus TaxID=1962232 RepID=UPI003A951CDB
MKILQVCARIPYPVEDGGSVYVFNTTKHLAELGNEVHVASFFSEVHNQDPKGFGEYCTLHHQKGNFTPYTLASVVKATLTRESVNIQHRMDVNIMESILKSIQTNFDVIILEGLHSSNFLTILRTLFPNTPIVLRHVNVEFELIAWKARNEKNPLKKLFLYDQSRLLKTFELNTLNAVDAITFISDLDYNSLRDSFSEKPTLISPPGVKVTKTIPFSERPENHLIAFSNWKWSPNLDGLVWFLKNVWHSLKLNYPEISLTIAGNDLPKRIHSSLPEGINYIGFVDDLHTFNKKGTIQIVPLISGSGVKLKVIEGLGFGNPIVSTSFGIDGIKAIQGEHFELANTPKEFVDKIGFLLNNEKHRKELSTNSVSLILGNYSWTHHISELNKFLSSLI